LSLWYTEKSWPEALREEFGPATSLVVRLACARTPSVGSTEALEAAAAERLLAWIAGESDDTSLEDLDFRAETRNAKLVIVRNDLENLKAYVQSIAGAGTPENAQAVIASAGMAVRKITAHDKAALEARQGSVSGTVNLIAKAAGRTAAYDWQYSTDQKTWTTAPMTLQAKTGVSGLTVGTMYYFRVQAVTRTGAENWSQIVSLLVK
jgi:hypothetical protein